MEKDVKQLEQKDIKWVAIQLSNGIQSFISDETKVLQEMHPLTKGKYRYVLASEERIEKIKPEVKPELDDNFQPDAKKAKKSGKKII